MRPAWPGASPGRMIASGDYRDWENVGGFVEALAGSHHALASKPRHSMCTRMRAIAARSGSDAQNDCGRETPGISVSRRAAWPGE